MKTKNMIVGVSGGIAAYKSCELIRRLKKTGHHVKVVLTDNAKKFVSPCTFSALSQNEVYDSVFTDRDAMIHISLAKWADAIIIAPATANFMSDLACGRANTLLSCICLASNAACYIAPAMNSAMWSHLATQENLKQLNHYGYKILMPLDGEQACGDVGIGRMLEPEDIFNTVCEPSQKLTGLRIVITAGPTIERIDPVRFLSNFSSGKMGYTLAHESLNQDASVTLITGKTHLNPPTGCNVINVTTAKEMLQASLREAEASDIFISAAAIADYTVQPMSHKIKKNAEKLTLQLERTEDILSTIAIKYPNVFSVGFCAETHDLLDAAKEKKERKGCSAIIANTIRKDGYPFGHDDNDLTYINKEHTLKLGRKSKREHAVALMKLIYNDFKIVHGK